MEVAGQGMSNCRSTLLGGALSGRQPIVQKRHANANRCYFAELAYDACPWIAMARKHCCNGNEEGREEFQSGRCQEWPKEQLKG